VAAQRRGAGEGKIGICGRLEGAPAAQEEKAAAARLQQVSNVRRGASSGGAGTKLGNRHLSSNWWPTGGLHRKNLRKKSFAASNGK